MKKENKKAKEEVSDCFLQIAQNKNFLHANLNAFSLTFYFHFVLCVSMPIARQWSIIISLRAVAKSS
jgi:hypothetical protein